MFLRRQLSFLNKVVNIRLFHDGSQAENTLKTVSSALFTVGKERFEAEKTSENVYQHFMEPTLPLNHSDSDLEDFKEIHSVILNFGSPEMADQMSGAIYMHASMSEDKCSQVCQF